MSNVHDLPCQPDSHVISEFMSRLFANSGHEGLVEIAWTSPHYPHQLNAAALFDLADLSEAIDHAARVNAMQSCNVYVSAGLRRPGTNPKARASDGDVFALCAHWADFDAPYAMAHAIEKTRQHGLTPNLITFTGNEPHRRGQMWWFLDEPTTDLKQHRLVQSALATALGGDVTVTNPSRVMRLIGSVAWPLKQGRVLEMTGIDSAPRVLPYTAQELHEKLERAGLYGGPSGPEGLRAEYKETWAELINGTFTPHEWHRSMVKIVARWVARGHSFEEIMEQAPLFQRAGYTLEETLEQVKAAALGAQKWGYDLKGTPIPQPEGALELVPFLALQSRDPPAFQVAGVVPEKGFGYIYGKSATLKTFVTLDLALSIAFGRAWQGRPVKPGRVLYILGEGQGAFANRVRSWQEARGLAGADCPFWTLFNPIQFTNPTDVARLVAAIETVNVAPDWVFVDTVARNFGAGDPDKTQDMTVFVNAVDAVRQRFGCGVFAVHHAGKDETKGARNSSVLQAAADFEIRTEREEGSPAVTLVNTKAKDWEEFPRMRLATKPVAVIDPRTGEEVTSLVVVEGSAEEVGNAPVRGKPSAGNEELIMAVLRKSGTLTQGEIVARSGLDKSSVSRSLVKLRAKNCIAKDDELGLHWIPEEYQ